MGLFKRAVADLFELRNKYFENGVENFRLSNEMSRNFQVIISTLVLAELAFIGTLGFEHEQKIISAIAATILLLALVLFLIGISIHQVVIQNAAKDSFRMAAKVDDYIKKNEKQYEKELPDELKSKNGEKMTRRINRGSRILRASYVLISIASLLLIVMIWKLSLAVDTTN